MEVIFFETFKDCMVSLDYFSHTSTGNYLGRCKDRDYIITDPHPVAQNWVHWLVINMPANISSLEEGASRKKMPPGCMELKNSFGDICYGGPQPPKGTGDHPYVFTLYALSVEKLDLGVNTTLPAFKKALEGKILDSAMLTGKYGR